MPIVSWAANNDPEPSQSVDRHAVLCEVEQPHMQPGCVSNTTASSMLTARRNDAFPTSNHPS
ncbi:hypothetical protein [Rubinisphaera sp.]|uniref:hypothetical protein n=1 Tax=Rubinisphaera sp. TaxID=2024857 RepID=UPI000C1223CD|nr:hypothetical protein [Rubinisphaera sp.]MBV10252.1 hypothetical protein [Rubinisphaera sp.]